MKKLIVLFILLAVFSFSFAAGTNPDNFIAVKAGKIVTVSGPLVNNGTILIKGDKIQQLGSDINIPPGYKIYEYSDGVVYPGLINSMTTLGISGISSINQWSDYEEKGKFNPQLSAFSAFYPWSNLIPNTRDFGTLIALSAPTGGIISGKALLVSLHGWTPGDMFIKKEVALMIKLPEPPEPTRRRRPTLPDTSEKDKTELHQFINGAHKYYLRSGKSHKTSNSNDFNPKFAAMKPIWEKHLPVIISAESEKNIRFALHLGKEFNLNVILYNVYDGEKVLKEIKASGYPVILGAMYTRSKDWEDGCDIVFRLPALLAGEGILFAFATGSRSAAAFDLPLHAGRAAAYGLSPDDALKALTLYPAKIFAIEEYGSIEPGKIADLVIANGNILETSTVVKDVFIKGKKITAKSFFQKEFQRARDKISGETR
jgi:imidazolonepropionase-like amidohydrolase